MTEHDDRRFALEAIAYGDDPRISPSDRMKALELLDALPGGGTSGGAAMAVLAAQVEELSGEALDAELVGFFNPGWEDPPPPPPPSPGSEQDIEKRVEARTKKRMRRWIAEQTGRRDPSKPEPDRVAAQAPPKPSTEPQRPSEDELAQRRAKVIRLDTGEAIDLGAPMTSAEHAIAQSKIIRQQARDQIREEKRKRHPFGRHMPPGTDPAVWDSTFR